MTWALVFAMTGVAAGRLRIAHWVRWVLIVGSVSGTHLVLWEADPIIRMVGLCSVLLASMKGLVYAVWGGSLSVGSYLMFTFCWFGMDPGSFRVRREGLSWASDIWMGFALLLSGIFLGGVVWAMEWRGALVMFLPLSLSFHFGFLRVLKGLLRAKGVPVRTLFPNLLKTRGVADFWSRRWNVGYSQMMQRVVGRPVGDRLGTEAGILAVFVGSGLLHELAITLPVQAGYGWPTLYFLGHGLLVLMERRWGRALGKLPALLLVAIPLGGLFPEKFRSEVIERSLSVYDLVW